MSRKRCRGIRIQANDAENSSTESSSPSVFVERDLCKCH